MKIVRETRKIPGEAEIMVNQAVAHVPVRFGRPPAVHFETRTKVTVGAARKLLNSSAGAVLLEGREYEAIPIVATA